MSDEVRPASGVAAPAMAGAAPRWLVILAWSTGPAGLYALLGLAHAAFVERVLTLDVGFGRSLSFWVVSLYVALPLWGFLPARPAGWYARRPAIVGAALIGAVALAVCGGYTLVWTIVHWNARVGVPVLAGIIAVSAVAVATLWYASKAEPR